MSGQSQLDKLLEELDRAGVTPPNMPTQSNDNPSATAIGALGGQSNAGGLGYTGSSGSAPPADPSQTPTATNPQAGGATRNPDGNYQRTITDVCQTTPCLAGCPDSSIRSKCPENFTDAGTTHTSDGTIFKQSDWDIFFPWKLQVPDGNWVVQWRFLARQRLKYFRGKSVEHLKQKYAMRIIDAYVAYTLAYFSERRDGRFIHEAGREGYNINGKGVTPYMANRIEVARQQAIQDENTPPPRDEVRPPRTTGSGSGSGSRGQPTPVSQNPKMLALDELITNNLKPEVLGVYEDYGWKTFPDTKDWDYTRRVKIPNFKFLPKPTAVHPAIWDEIRDLANLRQNDPRSFLETYTVAQIKSLDKRLYAFNRRAKAINKVYPFSEWINDALREMRTIDKMREIGFPDTIDEKKHPQLLKYNLLWNWKKSKANPYGYDLSEQYFNYDESSILKFKKRIKEGALYYSGWQRIIDEAEDNGLKVQPNQTQAENRDRLSFVDKLTPKGRTARWFYTKQYGWFDDSSYIFLIRGSKTHKFKGRIKDIDRDPSWVWKEFGALIQQDEATMKRLFYNDPMAVLTKYILDYHVRVEKLFIREMVETPEKSPLSKFKTRKEKINARLDWVGDRYPPLLLSLAKKAQRLTWAGDPVTKLYFYPSQILKTLAPRDRRTNQVDVRKVNFWRNANLYSGTQDLRETGRDERMPVPTPPKGRDQRLGIDKRRLIDEIKLSNRDNVIGNEKDSLINRAKLMGVTFTEDPQNYTVTQLQVAIQSYFRQGEGYKPSRKRMEDGKRNWRDWATQELSTIEQYGIVGLSEQGDPNNRHFLLNSLVAKYVYLPVSQRPNPLLGKWFYEKSYSSKNVAMYRHRSRNEVKIGLRGTKDGMDYLTDAFVLSGYLDITKAIDNILGYDSYVVRIKKAVDKIIKDFPRDKWQYSMAGHSLGGLACVFVDLWLQNDYMKANGTKREDRNGVDQYVLKAGVKPWKHIQITTFDAGAGAEQAVKSMIGFMNSFVNRYKPKSKKSSEIKLRQYRIQGDLISLAGNSDSAYSEAQSYTMSFAPRCPEQKGFQIGGEGHSMAQFIHNNFLPDADKIKCREFGKTGLRPRGSGARKYSDPKDDPMV